jgi:Na+-transporting methylmalonyl-CoA/oxaloacetate decarboxylase gamma subunit
LIISALGMTIVFLVLALTYGSILMLGWFERRYPVLAPAAAPAGAVSAPAVAVTPEEEAAIHAAIAHHMGRAPETFHTRITPEKKES